MIHILALIVVLFRLSAPANGLPIIDEQQNGIETMKIENASAPKKVYTSSMFEHWIKPGSRGKLMLISCHVFMLSFWVSHHILQ